MKALCTMLLASLAFATPAMADYSLEADTFSAGGGVSNSAGYENLGIIGQPGIVGILPVLGGWKILYPVISATPGTLTFTLSQGAFGNLPLGISNTGGSNLSWSVAKNSADSIFNLTPSSGSNSGSVTVTANAAGLAVGTYHNTLTVSGAGIQQTVLVQLDLTVSAQTLYTLAVTLRQATPGKGGGNITMAIPPAPAAETCSHLDPTCSFDFPAGSTVTLSQFPDSNTQRGTWGAPGCGSNPSCQIVLNTPQGTDITFPYSSMAKINLGTGYESLALAYGGAASIDTIKARAVAFPLEDLLLNSGKSITLLGGLDAYYAPQVSQYSTLSGKLTVGTGSLIVDKLIIK
jgi:hypothetical protein